MVMKQVSALGLVFFLFLGISNTSFAQTQSEGYYRYTVIDGDTVPIVDMPVCYIGDTKPNVHYISQSQLKKYNRLNRYVRKVYPYASLAAKKLNECEKELIGVEDEKERKRIMKKVEKALKDKYGDELKRLTVTQGKILLKLIDRETGQTSFELVKELRGGFSASMWQGLALIFGHTLKANYDPAGEDWMIEEIVQKIESGN